MPRPRSRRPAAILGSLALALAGLTGLVAAPAQANPAGTGLVISEVYGGGGNSGGVYKNDFIELYNPTSEAIPLSGLSLQYRSTSGGVGGTQTLSGSVAAHGHWLSQEAAGANTALPALPTPDGTGTLSMSGTGGQVLLINGSSFSGSGNLAGNPSLVDMVGWGSSTSYEGAPAAGTTNSTSAARAATGADTDNNATDFTVGAPSPENAGGNAAPLTVAAVSDRTVAVDTPISPIQLTATGGTAPYTWEATGLPAGLTLAGDTISGTPTTAGTYPVTVTATDSSVPALTDDEGFTLEVQGATELSIAQIQGTDADASPYVGQQVRTTGVVTAVYATGGFNGFFLETGGAGGTASQDQTPGASDGVFVFGANSAAQVAVGESVEVVGKVAEYFGSTEIEFPTVTKAATELPAVVPDQLAWSDLASDAQKEAHEGELVAPQGSWTVTDDFDTNFYGEIGLASGGAVLRQPTDVGTPGSPEAQAAAADNAARAVTLDDGSSWTFTSTSHSSDPLPWLTPSTPVSVGSAVTFHQPVVLDYRNSLWKFQPTAQVVGDGSNVATFSDLRGGKAAPGSVGGDVRLATFNVENFFPTTVAQFLADHPDAHCTTYKDRDGNPIAAESCSFADGSAGPRGAATQESYERQLAKIVYGINHLGASVVSLEEVENSEKFGHTRDWALQKLVDALNADAGAGTWAYAPSPSDADLPPLDQQDVIRTAFIYRPGDVALVGASHVLTDHSDPGESFSIAREPLAQGFKAAGTPDIDAFLVIANHLKSKGAGAGLFDDCPNGGDAENVNPAYDQGAFNCTRFHEVRDLWSWAQGQAQALGTSRLFLVGDFNAYNHEDPMEYLYHQGFTDLGGTYDPDHASYSFNGLQGSLDHVLASPDALTMVTGADVWQINAQESVANAYSRHNYNVTNLFDPNTPWAASDHDPEVVGLTLPRDKAPSTVTAPAVTAVWPKEAARFPVTVTAPGAQPTGTVTLLDHGTPIGSADLDDGTAVISLPEKSYKRGTYTFTVAYSGDDQVQPGSTPVTLTVTSSAGK